MEQPANTAPGAPPGKVVRAFDDDPAAMARILIAVRGLHAHFLARLEQVRDGSPAYHALMREIGSLSVIEAQCARALEGTAIAAALADLRLAESLASTDRWSEKRR